MNLNQTPKNYREVSTDGRIRINGIQIGIIKRNNDAQRMGRLDVYIPELGGDPDSPSNWYTVNYASPFAGATPVNKNKPGGKDMPDTQISYGLWMVPPDLDNEVLCCFANGDPTQGFWFACLYQSLMNHMVPGIGLNVSTKDEINKLNLPPVAEYNKKDDINGKNIWKPQRPIFEPLHNSFVAQGLYKDPERGPSTTSARREAPSQVFGFSTPRGNNIHIDDDPKNEFIRMRTRSGVQIVIHETTGYIYMISKNGNSWMEISDIGIDMYSKRSISMRAEENINLHADQSVIIHGAGAIHQSGTNLTRRSAGQISEEAGGKINRNSPQIRDNSRPEESGGTGPTGPSGTGGTGGPTGPTGENGPKTNAKQMSKAEMDAAVGKSHGRDQECVSLAKKLGTDQNGRPLGPASGWSKGDVTPNRHNYKQYVGMAVATANDNGQYHRNGGVSNCRGGVCTHAGILAGWNYKADRPILLDQSNGRVAAYRTQPARYGNFSLIKQR